MDGVGNCWVFDVGGGEYSMLLMLQSDGWRWSFSEYREWTYCGRRLCDAVASASRTFIRMEAMR